jgi:hypothetical protein
MFSSNSSQVSSAVNYIEDVFSTYLYTGNGSTQTITNGIDLSGQGGLVWIKGRTDNTAHSLTDTVNGAGTFLSSNTTTALTTSSDNVSAFSTTGFTASFSGPGKTNENNQTYVSWTFREQPKFFDIVTYTGTGSNTTFAHSLGSVPGSIIVKRTDTAADWAVYHRSLANTEYLVLNTTAAAATGATWWNSTTPTSTVFSVGTDASVNASGGTYVAYVFAHDASGFGTAGTDNVISCGSYAGVGSTQQDITLGYEPQWVMIKRTDISDSWIMVDNMRGFFQTADNALCANNANSEAATVSMSGAMQPTATGFHLYNANSAVNASGGTYIYIAIRRGPMKVPTLGTSVFQPVTYSGIGSNDRLVNTTITPDLFIDMRRENIMPRYVLDRLRGNAQLYSNLTSAESVNTAQVPTNTFNVNQTGITVSADELNASGRTFVIEAFRRAPGFFDVCCYTGTGSNTTFTHNLGVVPELMIVKRRDTTADWDSYCSALANTEYVVLNTTAAKATGATRWNSTTPTSSVFSVGTSTTTNASAGTYVAYLFASTAGVSKVGSYTGNGTTQTINCGFTGGVRFVLIKRTDATGDWYVYDTARGMTVLTDPYLLINSTAAETATLGSVTTVSTGFALDSAILAAINVNAGSYIFLAIA